MKHSSLAHAALAAMIAVLVACEEGPPRYDMPPGGPAPDRAVSSAAIEAERFQSWQPAERAAYISGRVEAAAAIYAAGEADAAKQQLEGLAPRADGIASPSVAEAGSASDMIDALSGALALERPAEEIAPLFDQATVYFGEVLAGSGQPPRELVTFLMQRSAEAYDRSVRLGEVTDPELYQAAFGYVAAARRLAGPLDPEAYGKLQLELNILALMWPASGPVTGPAPPPEMRMAEQYARVKLALAGVP